MKLPTTYDAQSHEPGIYKLWEDSGLFVANPTSSKEHFAIDMPPPNETGMLHIGHALGITLQDILARHARLSVKDVLWLPGTDHSALPTNAIIEEQLRQEGTNKYEIGREEFLKRTREFVASNRDTINNQIRAMGASVDWTRARYTLSDSLSRSVNEVFVRMFNDGLIYRGHRLVNWDPKFETNVSDDEVEYLPEKTKLYTLKYGPFEISTARPETKFGDKYVVMHPEDKRYAKYNHGDQFEAEWINGKVKATVIKDAAVDPNFGTGVMTITPWHSQIDFEIAERHGLDREQIIDLKGNLLPIAQEFAGMSIEEARPKIIDKLESKGLLVSVKDDYMHRLALNSRGKGIIEPQIRLQWFVDVNKPAVDWRGTKLSFKEVMQAVIRQGDIKIIPSRYDKVYFHWVDNLRDWCISRQIWWGHQIPVWYKKVGQDHEETYVGVLPPANESEWQRDPDTLDTWFSSALWTWSTLIDPRLAADYSLTLDDLLKSSPDYLAYHPTNVLDTASDILFFWVARMILTTTYMTKQVPFKTVYLHGLVLNETGGKMSKSKPETSIDPMIIIPEYGTDALRLALIQGITAGNSQKLVRSKIVTNRNFCNKLWNVARYIEDITSDSDTDKVELKDPTDHWIVGRLIKTKDSINTDLDHFQFSDAYHQLYHFLWDDLADWYIEASKVKPNKPLLKYLLKNFLTIAHPLAPFVTEAIWQKLDTGSLLAAQTYQKIINHNSNQAELFESLRQVISEIRYIKHGLNEKNVVMSYEPNDLLNKNRTLIKKLAVLAEINQTLKGQGLKLTGTKFNIWLSIDPSKARGYLKKLEQRKLQQEGHINRLKTRLSNKSYTNQAPAEIIAETRMQLSAYEQKLTEVNSEIELFRTL